MQPVTLDMQPPKLQMSIQLLQQEDRDALNSVAGVQVSTRALKSGKLETKLELDPGEVNSKALLTALMEHAGKPKSRLIAFANWTEGKLGSVYWLCKAEVAAMHEVTARCQSQGLWLVPTMVRTATLQGEEWWLCNGEACALHAGPEPMDCTTLLRSQGMAISASWEPHLLQLTGIATNKVYFNAMKCLPSGNTSFKLEELPKELTTPPEASFQPGCPLPVANMPDTPNKHPAAGCAMVPILHKQSMTWVVPMVPPTQVAALATWLAHKQIQWVDLEPADFRPKQDLKPPLKCKAAHKKLLTQAINEGQWKELSTEHTEHPDKGQQCARCAGVHSKHLCPHSPAMKLLEACGHEEAQAMCVQVAWKQQLQWVRQTKNKLQHTQHSQMQQAIARLWRDVVTPRVDDPKPVLGEATSEAQGWQVATSKKQRRKKRRSSKKNERTALPEQEEAQHQQSEGEHTVTQDLAVCANAPGGMAAGPAATVRAAETALPATQTAHTITVTAAPMPAATAHGQPPPSPAEARTPGQPMDAVRSGPPQQREPLRDPHQANTGNCGRPPRAPSAARPPFVPRVQPPRIAKQRSSSVSSSNSTGSQ